MSLYKTPKSRYWQYDFQWKNRRFYGSTGCTARRDAEAVESRIRAEALTRPLGAKPEITVDFAAGLYATRIQDMPAWGTSQFILAAMVKGLGKNRLLSEIQQATLCELVARRRDGRTNASVNREIEDWRAVWRWAARNKYEVGDMPDWGALFLPVLDRDPRELSTAEEKRLFKNLRPDHHPMVRFALHSGWRLSEVIHLRWADVDLETATAVTRLKGGYQARRPLSRVMLAILTSQPRICPQVFTYIAQRSRATHTDKLGRQRVARKAGERYPYSTTGWRKPWKKALKDAGILAFRFHDLRHTAGTRLLRATGNLKVVQQALKHRSIQTTLRYAHALDEDVRRAYDAADSRNSPGAKRKNSKK